MSAFEYLNSAYKDDGDNERQCPRWRYHGPGYGQGMLHFIGILEPHQVVTGSSAHGWLGSCEDFIKQFELVR